MSDQRAAIESAERFVEATGLNDVVGANYSAFLADLKQRDAAIRADERARWQNEVDHCLNVVDAPAGAGWQWFVDEIVKLRTQIADERARVIGSAVAVLKEWALNPGRDENDEDSLEFPISSTGFMMALNDIAYEIRALATERDEGES